MSTDPFTEKERLALAKLDAAIQAIQALPAISPVDFEETVVPCSQTLRQLIYWRAAYRRSRVVT